MWCEHRADLEAAAQSEPDSDSVQETADGTCPLLTHLPCLQPQVREERRQGAPHLPPLVPCVAGGTLKSWGRLMTHSVARGIPGI